jgi:hypothetical protein
MKMQTGPLLTIIAGFVIAAVGVLWHVHMARTGGGAAPRSVAPNVELRSEGEGKTASDIGAKSPGIDISVGQDDKKNTSVEGSHEVDRAPDPRSETATTPVEMRTWSLNRQL